MAEGFARHLGAGVVEASSAGLYPAPIIQPETFAVMAERQAPLEDRPPRRVLALNGADFDLIVNMSGWPVAHLLPGFAGREIAWKVPDPIGQPLGVYRQVCDQIERSVQALIEELRASPAP